MTLWSKQLGEQCWALLVYGTVETKLINSSVFASSICIFANPMKCFTHTGGREGGREGGRREGGRGGGREKGEEREGGKERGREGGREGEREGERERKEET